LGLEWHVKICTFSTKTGLGYQVLGSLPPAKIQRLLPPHPLEQRLHLLPARYFKTAAVFWGDLFFVWGGSGPRLKPFPLIYQFFMVSYLYTSKKIAPFYTAKINQKQ